MRSVQASAVYHSHPACKTSGTEANRDCPEAEVTGFSVRTLSNPIVLLVAQIPLSCQKGVWVPFSERVHCILMDL